jgi:hypothetical protein
LKVIDERAKSLSMFNFVSYFKALTKSHKRSDTVTDIDHPGSVPRSHSYSGGPAPRLVIFNEIFRSLSPSRQMHIYYIKLVYELSSPHAF